MRSEAQADQAQPSFNGTRLLRINQVLQKFPVSRTRWWDGVREGLYPKGIKLSPRTTAWRESEIDALIDRLSEQA